MIKKILSNSTLLILLGVLLYLGGKHFYMMPKQSSGELAPAFTAEIRSGETIKLSDFKGKFVLLDFWGSWCGPCLQEMPDLIALNEKYKSASFQDGKGFEMISVGVETNEKRWEGAIERKNLNWKYHILDLATSLRFFDSKIASLYGVKQVPTKYLINPQGEIIGINLPFEEMDEILTKNLK